MPLIFNPLTRPIITQGSGLLKSSLRTFQNRLRLEVLPTFTHQKTDGLLEKIQIKVNQGFHHFSVVERDPIATRNFVVYLKGIFPELEVVPHLSVLRNNSETLKVTFSQYQKVGIEKIFIIRGDRGFTNIVKQGNALAHTALSDLSIPSVSHLIKKVKNAGFTPTAACYPEGHPFDKADQDKFQNALEKQQSGVSHLVSQCVYNIEPFLQYKTRAKQLGLHVPIIPCVLPTLDIESMQLVNRDFKISLNPGFIDLSENEKLTAYATLISELLNEAPQIHYATCNNFKLMDKLLNYLEMPRVTAEVEEGVCKKKTR